MGSFIEAFHGFLELRTYTSFWSFTYDCMRTQQKEFSKSIKMTYLKQLVYHKLKWPVTHFTDIYDQISETGAEYTAHYHMCLRLHGLGWG